MMWRRRQPVSNASKVLTWPVKMIAQVRRTTGRLPSSCSAERVFNLGYALGAPEKPRFLGRLMMQLPDLTKADFFKPEVFRGAHRGEVATQRGHVLGAVEID